MSGGTVQVSAGLRSDHAGLPADPGTDDEAVLIRQVLHDLAVSGVQPLGAEPGCLLEQGHDIRGVEGKPPELRHEFLLAQPIGQFVGRRPSLLRGAPREDVPLLVVHAGVPACVRDWV
jgi:hypothetical protein